MSDTSEERRGLMLVLSSPSGAGKTTISRRLLEFEPALNLSVSVTTRKPRTGERDGVDYWFIDRMAFDEKRAAGDLLESAEVFGNGYGSPRGPVETALSAGRDVLFDVDWQGTRQLRDAAGADVVSIFILPPSASALHQRLVHRRQDTEEVVADRMSRAASEIEHWHEYDYVVINSDVERSVRSIRAIVRAERLRTVRRTGLGPFVMAMQTEL